MSVAEDRRNSMGGGYGGGARFECTLRIAGAGAAEIAWEEATEGERGVSVAEDRWGWSCRNSMGGGYGGGARFECTLRIAGAGDAEIAWEEATEGERGLSAR